MLKLTQTNYKIALKFIRRLIRHSFIFGCDLLRYIRSAGINLESLRGLVTIRYNSIKEGKLDFFLSIIKHSSRLKEADMKIKLYYLGNDHPHF